MARRMKGRRIMVRLGGYALLAGSFGAALWGVAHRGQAHLRSTIVALLVFDITLALLVMDGTAGG